MLIRREPILLCLTSKELKSDPFTLSQHQQFEVKVLTSFTDVVPDSNIRIINESDN